MSIFDPTPSPWASRMLAIFRVVAGAAFVTFGTMKVFGYPPLPPGIPPIGLLSQAGIGGILEVIGGSAIILGLFTRPVAFVLAGEMAVAYLQFHAPLSVFPSVNLGAPAILYCFFFLYLVFAGPGAWSIDGVIARSRAAKAS